MLKLVDTTATKEPDKCFKVTYTSNEVELIIANSMGVTEDLREFITFYSGEGYHERLVCMINQSLIRKIETIILPKGEIIADEKK